MLIYITEQAKLFIIICVSKWGMGYERLIFKHFREFHDSFCYNLTEYNKLRITTLQHMITLEYVYM